VSGTARLTYTLDVTVQDDPDLARDNHDQFRSRWRAESPTGEQYLVCMAPRGHDLYGSPPSDAVSIIVTDIYAAARHNGTWKVGVFRREAMRLRRAVFKKNGLTHEEAETEVARLRDCIRRGAPL
jgi:hypothetical protein